MAADSNGASNLEAAWDYARGYYKDDRVLAGFEPLARRCPEAFIGYMTMRQGLFREPPVGALSPKTKELAILAMECALKKTNPPPLGHTRRAIEAGASVDEISEVVGLAIMIGGMLTYQESGRFVLEEAERLASIDVPG